MIGRPVPGAKVKVFHNLPKGVQAAPKEATPARIRLKLYALAYVESRHGVDASPAMCWDALVIFCQAAIHYVAALEGKSKSELVDPTIHEDRGPNTARTMTGLPKDRIAAARTELKLMAIAYEATRRGADSNSQAGGFGMAMVCQAAVRYVEALEGPGSDKSHLTSRLALDE